jgi:hypothetical protein
MDRLRSMLDDSTLTYERIAKKLGITKQRVARLAKEFGINGRKRRHERWVVREPRIIKFVYSRNVRTVIAGLPLAHCSTAESGISRVTKRAKFALLAVKYGTRLNLYVIPLSHLQGVSSVYIPAEGKYVGSSRKPRKDWTRYEGLWHLLDSTARAAL